jgi:hypothetical protein
MMTRSAPGARAGSRATRLNPLALPTQSPAFATTAGYSVPKVQCQAVITATPQMVAFRRSVLQLHRVQRRLSRNRRRPALRRFGRVGVSYLFKCRSAGRTCRPCRCPAVLASGLAKAIEWKAVMGHRLPGDFCLGSDSAVRFGRVTRQLHPNEQTFETTISNRQEIEK